MTTLDILSAIVDSYFKEHEADSIVITFSQKYEADKLWDHEIVVASRYPDGVICFDWDFCEGQTCIAAINIIELPKERSVL